MNENLLLTVSSRFFISTPLYAPRALCLVKISALPYHLMPIFYFNFEVLAIFQVIHKLSSSKSYSNLVDWAQQCTG